MTKKPEKDTEDTGSQISEQMEEDERKTQEIEQRKK